MKTFAFRAAAFGAAAVAVALCASAAQATTVHEGQGILSSFDHQAHTTDNYLDLDVKSATVSYDANNIYLSATMFGTIGSTDTGFYVWGVNTGTGTDFFQQQADHPDVGKGINFDTFIVLNTDLTGSVHYFSGEPNEGIEKITIDGNTIRAVISREVLEDAATIDISKFGFNLWSRTTGFAHNSDIPDFAPDDHNFNASASVPEPATWALLIAGFGFVGSTLRSRRRSPLAA
jgi:hypothetical protein